ncbi:FlaG/FlaF family flagellin (archaellin) [Kurthia huakuii]|nr:FlaG/FlaF family flagellin (archaellin) [Kurthia huakuii]
MPNKKNKKASTAIIAMLLTIAIVVYRLFYS